MLVIKGPTLQAKGVGAAGELKEITVHVMVYMSVYSSTPAQLRYL